MRILRRDIVHDRLLESAAQVQVLQPDQVALILRPFEDRLNVRDPGKYRRNEAYRPDARVVDLLHSRETSFDADRRVHIVFEIFIQRVHRP